MDTIELTASTKLHQEFDVPDYPTTRKVHQLDKYHGTIVADPYRWLEDKTSLETAAWIAAQRSVAEQYLSKLALRQQLRQRFEELLQYRRWYDLVRRRGHLFYRFNSGRQNQLVVQVQKQPGASAEVVIDPSTLSADATASVQWFMPSRDARYLLCSISHAGSDWHEYIIQDVANQKAIPETLRWIKMSTIGWCGNGFYYSRFPETLDSRRALSARNTNHQVWYHRVGTPQCADRLVYEDGVNRCRLHFVETTEDERFVVLSIRDADAVHAANALLYIDVASGASSFRPVVPDIRDSFRVVGSIGDRLLTITDCSAPNERLVLIDPTRPDLSNWLELIPERDARLEHVSQVNGKLVVLYQRDGAHELLVFDQSGVFETAIPLPGIGRLEVFRGEVSDRDVLWSFTNFTTPPTIYCYDLFSRHASPLMEVVAPFQSEDYVTRRVFYPSQDGTQVPMFLVHRKELALDGSHPCLLYGYGGNGAAMTPAFDPFIIALLEHDVVYAVPCLRGGGEYGEAWHRAGWRESKQNVFDDCIAAATWLQSGGYTSPARTGLAGRSNGGLLVGAVMVQRPDLFAVALPSGAVMDMLRYQEFTVGWSWITEYGSSDDPDLFPILLGYSPLHNIMPSVRYPATLVMVSEHDDRVVPAHSFKFIATLQELGKGPGPYLIRIDTNTGHGPTSLSKLLDERVDMYAFLLHFTGAGGPKYTAARPGASA